MLCCAYVLSGFIGRDGWKSADMAALGYMAELAQGTSNWLAPTLMGVPADNPAVLPYWLGAWAIQLTPTWIDTEFMVRIPFGLLLALAMFTTWYGTYYLARNPIAQPVAFAFGGEPTPKEYGKTIADGALLIFLACVGLAIRVHEASPLILQLLGISLLLYGSMRGFDKPIQGGCIAGIALGVIALSGNLWTSILLCLASLISFHIGKKSLVFSWAGSLLACFIGFLSIWPLMWLYADASHTDISHAMHVWWGTSQLSSIVQLKTLEFLAVNFWAYTWPVWPLCFWSIYIWGKNGRQGLSARHLTIPGCILLTLLILFLFNPDLSEKYLMLLIPPMAILASFGLPFLRRGLISFIDWLSLLSFTIVAGFIWIIWLAKLTGFPQSTANNVARYLPGFVAQFNLLDLIIALMITAIWVLIVRWRVSRAPQVIWRCLIISASGTTLMWVLLMTLWLPTINYAKTYQPVAMRFAKALPANAKCIDSSFLGNAQLASFVYFTRLPLEDNPHCDFMLTHSSSEARAAAIMHQKRLTLLWEDRRDSDKDERLRLYQVSP